MRSVLLASVPIHGHVTPILAVARRLAERGFRVRFITGARWREAVESTGAEFLPLPPESDFDDRQDWNLTFPERAALHGIPAINFDIEHIFLGPAGGQYRAVRAALAAEPVDVVATDPAFAGGAFLIGSTERPPLVVLSIVPLTIRSRDTGPFGAGLPPTRGPLGWARNRSIEAILDRTLLKRPQQLTAAAYRETTGRELDFPVFDWTRHAEAIAQFTVPEFEYPRSDAPSTITFTGPVAGSPLPAPLPDWWSDLDGRRVVHVTQGTVANKDYRQIIAPTLEALEDEDVLVVVATGGRSVDTLPPLPANARAAEYLPYDELLPRTDVYLTNSGYGGIHYALRYGVPIVCTSGKEDKPEVSRRVEWSGVGVRLRSETPAPAAVRRAVHRVLEDPRYRAAAQRLSRSIREHRGADAVVEVLESVAR